MRDEAQCLFISLIMSPFGSAFQAFLLPFIWLRLFSVQDQGSLGDASALDVIR